MMKKYFFILISLTMTSMFTFGQVKFGIRAGINSSFIKAEDVENGNIVVDFSKDGGSGFHFGAMSQIQFFNLFIQPEFLFTTNRNDIILRDIISQEEVLVEQKFNKLVIPILTGIKIKPIKLEIGPVATVMLKSKSELADMGFKQTFNDLIWGFQTGLGLELGKISLDFKYEGNLGKFGKDITVDNTTFEFDQRQRQIIFSIGILF